MHYVNTYHIIYRSNEAPPVVGRFLAHRNERRDKKEEAVDYIWREIEEEMEIETKGCRTSVFFPSHGTGSFTVGAVI